jgi:hypothetical protein
LLASVERDEAWLRRVSRRAGTVTVYFASWLVALSLAPFAAVALALGAGPAARLALFAAVFLSYEMLGLAAALGLWARGHARDEVAHAALRSWWARGLFRAAVRLFALELEVSGDEPSSPGRWSSWCGTRASRTHSCPRWCWGAGAACGCATC